MAKWVSRFALGLSSSVPGVRIKPENYLLELDIGKDFDLVLDVLNY